MANSPLLGNSPQRDSFHTGGPRSDRAAVSARAHRHRRRLSQFEFRCFEARHRSLDGICRLVATQFAVLSLGRNYSRFSRSVSFGSREEFFVHERVTLKTLPQQTREGNLRPLRFARNGAATFA